MRRSLRKVLGFVDSQCKAEFVNERKAVIAILRRDPTLTEDEIVESIEAENEQIRLQEEIQAFFTSGKKDEEFDRTMEEYEMKIREIDSQYDEQQEKKDKAAGNQLS